MGTIGLDWQASGVGNFSSITAFRISTGVPTLRVALAKEDAPMQARGEKPPSRIIDFDALSDRGGASAGSEEQIIGVDEQVLRRGQSD